MRIKALFIALAILVMGAAATACATTSGGTEEPRAERASSDQPVRGGYY